METTLENPSAAENAERKADSTAMYGSECKVSTTPRTEAALEHRADESTICRVINLCRKLEVELQDETTNVILLKMEHGKILKHKLKLVAEIEHAIETLDADGDEHGAASVLRKALRDVNTPNVKLSRPAAE